MKTLMKDANDVAHIPMRRTITYAAALALNNNDYQLCLDLLSNTKQQNYVTIRNLKALAFAKLGRFDDALAILRASLEYDVPAEGGRKRSFSKNTVRFCLFTSHNYKFFSLYSCLFHVDCFNR